MRRSALRWSSRLVVVSLWLLSSSARADLIDPAEEACGKAGEACNVGGEEGACVAETCSRLDYGNMADGAPGTMEYECVRCVIGAEVTNAEPEPKPTDPAATDEPAPQGGPAPEPKTTAKGTRCAVGPSSSMMSLALGLGLLGLAVGRRRRR